MNQKKMSCQRHSRWVLLVHTNQWLHLPLDVNIQQSGFLVAFKNAASTLRFMCVEDGGSNSLPILRLADVDVAAAAAALIWSVALSHTHSSPKANLHLLLD